MSKVFSDKGDLAGLASKRYYLERAEAELDLAQQARHPGAVRAHYQLAERYLDQVYGEPDEDSA